MHLDDSTYLARFDAAELGPEHFDHRGHLYMAWVHLARYDLEEANARVCTGVLRLATRFGVPGKFHHTISEALMRIVAQRLERGGRDDFDVFLAANPDLTENARGVLARHYSDERLNSPEARAGWLAPDREPIQ